MRPATAGLTRHRRKMCRTAGSDGTVVARAHSKSGRPAIGAVPRLRLDDRFLYSVMCGYLLARLAQAAGFFFRVGWFGCAEAPSGTSASRCRELSCADLAFEHLGRLVRALHRLRTDPGPPPLLLRIDQWAEWELVLLSIHSLLHVRSCSDTLEMASRFFSAALFRTEIKSAYLPDAWPPAVGTRPNTILPLWAKRRTRT
jgi:hypothetical protein